MSELGQNRKSSMRAHVFRFATDSGHGQQRAFMSPRPSSERKPQNKKGMTETMISKPLQPTATTAMKLPCRPGNIVNWGI